MFLSYYFIAEKSLVDKIQYRLQEAVLPAELATAEITDHHSRFLTGHVKVHSDPRLVELSINCPIPPKAGSTVAKSLPEIAGKLVERELKEDEEDEWKLVQGEYSPILGKGEILVNAEKVKTLGLEMDKLRINQSKEKFITDPEEFLEMLSDEIYLDEIGEFVEESKLQWRKAEIPDIAPTVRGTFESLTLNAQTELTRTVRNGKDADVISKLDGDINTLMNLFFCKEDIVSIVSDTASKCDPPKSLDFVVDRVEATIEDYEATLSYFNSDKNERRSWDSLHDLPKAQSIQPFDPETMILLNMAIQRIGDSNGDLTKFAKRRYPREETQEAINLTKTEIAKGELILPVTAQTLASALIEILYPKKSVGYDEDGNDREEYYVWDSINKKYTSNVREIVEKAVNHWAIGGNGLKLRDISLIHTQIKMAAIEINLAEELAKISERYLAMKNCLVDAFTKETLPYTPEFLVLSKSITPYIKDFENMKVPTIQTAGGEIRLDTFLRDSARNEDGSESPENELLLIQIAKQVLMPMLFSRKPNIFLKGRTGAGKSAFITLLDTMLGGTGVEVDFTKLEEKFSLQHTVNAKLLYQQELPFEGFQGEVPTLKAITDGDLPMAIQRKNKSTLSVNLSRVPKIMATNHEIKFALTSEIGRIVRRFIFVGFEHKIQNADSKVHTWIATDRRVREWFTNYIIQADVPTETIVTQRSQQVENELIQSDPFNSFLAEQLEGEEWEKLPEPVLFSVYLRYAIKEIAGGGHPTTWNKFRQKVSESKELVAKLTGRGFEIKANKAYNPKDREYLTEVSKEFALLTPTETTRFKKLIAEKDCKKLLGAFPDLPKAKDADSFLKATAGKFEEKSIFKPYKLIQK